MKRTTAMKAAIKKCLQILIIAFCAGSVVNIFFYAFPSFSERLGNLVYDTWLRLEGPQPPSNLPVVVSIDEESLKEIGQLPWPRHTIAELVETLLEQDVAAIGLDIWLSEPDRTSPISVDSQLERDFGISLDLSKLPLAALDNDRYLKNVIAKNPVVIGAQAIFKGQPDKLDALPEPFAITNKAPLSSIAEMTGFLPPLPLISSVAPVGLLNIPLDSDGVTRKIPLLARAGDKIYPAISLLTFITAKQKNSKVENPILENGPEDDLQLRIGEIVIPIEDDGTFRPIFRGGRHTFPYFSAVDILNHNFRKEDLKGKIVFMGTAAHTLNNLRATPLDPEVASMEVHATLVDNFISGASIQPPKHWKLIQTFLIYFSALIGAAIFLTPGLPLYAALTVLSIIIYIAGSWLLFKNGVFISPIGAVVALLLTGATIVPFRYWLEQVEKWKLKKAFNQYVSPEVVARVLTEGENLLRGEQIEATVMFTDVRNFTTISEKLSPTQIVRLLNRYFTPMTQCVTSRNGTLDKFIGDALMAFWNAPVSVDNHPLQATLAALDMQEELRKLRPELLNEFGIEIYTGIGLYCGPVHVGNMGTNELMNYTCIGETVNLASRLEGLCKTYGIAIIASASVKKGCNGSVEFLPIDKIRVKGSSRPIEIFSPLGLFPECGKPTLDLWENGLQKYFRGDFRDALKDFKEIPAQALPQTLTALFIGRCRMLLDNPPQNWRGIWDYHVK